MQVACVVPLALPIATIFFYHRLPPQSPFLSSQASPDALMISLAFISFSPLGIPHHHETAQCREGRTRAGFSALHEHERVYGKNEKYPRDRLSTTTSRRLLVLSLHQSSLPPSTMHTSCSTLGLVQPASSLPQSSPRECATSP